MLFAALPPMDEQEFLETCARTMDKEDYLEIESVSAALVSADDKVHFRSEFLDRYVSWEKNFRNELSRLRARKLGRNEEAFFRPARPADDAARSAGLCFSAEDPFQAELALERERWNAIERYSSLSAFDLDFLIAYRLKLAINQRIQRLAREAGEAGYNRLYKDILGRASSSAGIEKLGEQA
jgi:hypothetical protein